MTEEPKPLRYEQHVRVRSGAAAYVVLHGDMHIRGEHPGHWFEPFRLQVSPVEAGRARQQPSRLLEAENRVVAFTARERQLAELTDWRDDPASGVSVLLVHEPGGRGKTRLAPHLAVDSADQGWTVWAGQHVNNPNAQPLVTAGDTGSALLVIVEHAERWPADDLQFLLENPLLRRPRRARVLLVARQAVGWWPALRHRLGKANIAVGGTVALKPLAESTDERREDELLPAAE